MSYDVKNDDMSYWAHGPCAHQVSLRYLEKWAKYDHCLTTTTTTTTTPKIIIAKMKPHKNKIPFPFWGNGITRGTVPRGTVDPIPNELSLWPRTMFRQVTPSHDHWRHLIHTYMYIYIHVDMYIYKWRVAHIYPIGGLSVLGTAMRDLILSLH